MIEKRFQYHENTYLYRRWGTGSQLIVALHGYGESSASFQPLTTFLPENYSIIAVDLPFHGGTLYTGNIPIEPMAWMALLKRILITEGFDPHEKFALIGYSMGGRIALVTYQLMHERVTAISLVASDGIKMNRWYWFATQTKIGDRLFKYTMQKPYWLMSLLSVAHSCKLMNRSIYKFARYYIDDRAAREALYLRWTCFSRFKVKRSLLRKLLKHQPIPIKGLYGKYDRIIPFEKSAKFWKLAGDTAQVKIVDEGHKLIQAKYATFIVPMMPNE